MSAPSTAGRDDALTVIALGVIAAAITTAAHEAVGHGGECLAIGGRITRLTNVYFDCKGQDAFTPIAGPIGNLLAGALAAVLFGLVPSTRPRLKLLLLLIAAFSLFWEAGYMLYAAVKGQGDYLFFLQNLGAQAYSRWLLIAPGLGLYIAGIALVGRGALSFGEGRAKGLLWPAWLGGALAEVAAASLYAPDRLAAMHQAALEIGAASIPLLIIPLRLWPLPGMHPATAPVARSWGWIAAAVAVFAVFALTLGRGIG